MDTDMTLTREQILAMPTGPMLDALVAEIILGHKAWKEKRGSETRGYYELCVIQKNGDCEPWKNYRDDKAERYTAISNKDAVKVGFFGDGFDEYSKRIEDAFEVVEKMRESGFEVSISAAAKETLSDWDVQFANLEIRTHGLAGTLPEAIVKSALLTQLKEAEVKA